MTRIYVLLLVLLALVAACGAPTGDLTPSPPIDTQTASASPTPNAITATPTDAPAAGLTQTSIASLTFEPAPTPTQEHIEDTDGFAVFHVTGTTNIRAGIGVSFPQLGQLHSGDYIVGYKTQVTTDGYRWLWILNTCAGDGEVSGFVAMTANVKEVAKCP